MFNSTWQLIEAQSRSDDDEVEMLLAAATSRWHWGRVGGPEEVATGDWQVAHVASLLGHGALALRFAQRSLATAQQEGWGGWRLASAHEGMARASAAAGDAEARSLHVAAAEKALAEETADDDRTVIADQLATVPPVA